MIDLIKYIILDVDRTLVNSFEPELLSFQEAIENIMGYRINEEQAKILPQLELQQKHEQEAKTI